MYDTYIHNHTYTHIYIYIYKYNYIYNITLINKEKQKDPTEVRASVWSHQRFLDISGLIATFAAASNTKAYQGTPDQEEPASGAMRCRNSWGWGCGMWLVLEIIWLVMRLYEILNFGSIFNMFSILCMRRCALLRVSGCKLSSSVSSTFTEDSLGPHHADSTILGQPLGSDRQRQKLLAFWHVALPEAPFLTTNGIHCESLSWS